MLRLDSAQGRFRGGTAMPLLNHFAPPLSGMRHWTSMHAAWANADGDV